MRAIKIIKKQMREGCAEAGGKPASIETANKTERLNISAIRAKWQNESEQRRQNDLQIRFLMFGR